MVLISKNALLDINENHHYILTTFKYHVYVDNFSNKIKKALKSLEYFPTAYEKTGYTINNLDICIKPYQSYLIFSYIYHAAQNNAFFLLFSMTDPKSRAGQTFFKCLSDSPLFS